ncbi:MAG: CRISPR-associated endonuclease Cas2, partial [Candidatus Roizmanbacteria bacterium]|nr:CRISPR-associated endonuclease Cas2 [Candidatus Roizmanbacteria bacterium]
LKRGQLYWYILEVIGLTLIAGGNPLRPTLSLSVKEIIKILKEVKRLNVEEKKIERSLKSLERKEIVNLEEKDDQVLVHIKDKKNPTIIKYSIKALLDFKQKNKRWKGKWFLVFFDVPEIQRNKRDYLRNFLQKIGFYRYQQSVYIFPYECEKEITLIKKIVEGAKYMKYIVAEKIEDENRIKTFFNL